MTDEQVNEIRNLYAGGMLQKNIARRYGCELKYIQRIIHKQSAEHRRLCIDCGVGTRKAIRCKPCKRLYVRQYNTTYQRARRAKMKGAQTHVSHAK